MTDVLTSSLLTDDERLADLTPDQLRQLIGLVDYDAADDPFPVTGWDAVVWVVGNATQTARHYQSAFGMTLVAYSGPETGHRHRQGFVLTSGSCRFVILGGVDPASEFHDHHRTARGRCAGHQPRGPRRRPLHRRTPAGSAPRILVEPHDETDEFGTVRTATLAAYGDTRHTLVDRSRYTGPYLPGWVVAAVGVRAAARSAEATVPGAGPRRRATSSSARWTTGSASTSG